MRLASGNVMRALLAALVAVFSSNVSFAQAGEVADNSQAIDAAIASSFDLIQRSGQTYREQRECFSCHHHALPALALAAARGRGIEVDAEQAQARSEHTIAYFNERIERLKQGDGVPGGPYSAGYALISLAADEWPADETTAALTTYLLKTQRKEGVWRIGTHRPPLEDSDFTSTAVALRGLSLFPPSEGREQHEAAIGRARAWLEQASPTTTEDRVFQLFGLHWSGADADLIRRAAADLLALQQPDGGWQQLLSVAESLREEAAPTALPEPIEADQPSDSPPGTSTDPYATGQALVALHACGALSPDDEAFRRGIAFLRAAQQGDGSWHVRTRSRPIQVYFESGYPHEKDQYVSITAAAWATWAMILAR